MKAKIYKRHDLEVTDAMHDSEWVHASDYALLEQQLRQAQESWVEAQQQVEQLQGELTKAKAWAVREYESRATIFKFVIRLKDLLVTDDESESIVTAITALQHRAEQAEAALVAEQASHEQTKSTMASEYEMDMNDQLRKNRDLQAALSTATARCEKLEAALRNAPTGVTGETHGDVIARYYAWYEGEREHALAEPQVGE